ncbi:MAG: hypothetical protein FGM24_04125 [Candidatus Kapabacteria bacterium]|nr:hypothetical protein [Candidatus Kapabacteria bacterium]
MRTLRWLLAGLATLAFWTVHVTAQDVMVPFDSAGTVLTYTAKDEFELNLFPDIVGLREARIWMTPDSVFTLEVSSGYDARSVRTRKQLTLADVRDIQRRFSEMVLKKRPESLYDQSGRPSLLWTSTIMGATYYGAALGAVVFGESFGESPVTSAFPFLVAGTAGFAMPYLLTKNSTITKGDASLMRSALILGPATGWGLTSLILGDNVANGDNYRMGFGVSLVTGVAGTFAAYNYSRSRNLQEGHANLISSSIIYGGIAGLCSGLIIGDIVEPSADVGIRMTSGLALAGSVAGFVVGDALGSAQHYTPGDATSFAVTTTLAGVLPLAIAPLLDNPDVSVIAGATMLTTIAGMYLGDRGVVGRDYSGDEAQYMLLGAAGGALLGLGVGIMTEASEGMPLLMLGGATITYAIVRAGFGEQASFRARSIGSLDLDWHINPTAPLVAASLNGISVPFIGLSGRF